MGHNSTEYVHTVTEALKLALADRDALYGDPDFAKVPAAALLSAAYAAERRTLIDPLPGGPIGRDPASPGDPAPGDSRNDGRVPPASGADRRRAAGTCAGGVRRPAAERHSPDTTTVNVADARGNLFSASPSSAWFFGGVFIGGRHGGAARAIGCRRSCSRRSSESGPGRQAAAHDAVSDVVLRDGKPFVALSSPGGDSQDQQALQVLLNLAVFGMRPQAAIEAPRFNSLHHEQSFGATASRRGRAGCSRWRIASPRCRWRRSGGWGTGSRCWGRS